MLSGTLLCQPSPGGLCLGKQAVDKLGVGPDDAVLGVQHPHKPEVFKSTKCMEDFVYGQLRVEVTLLQTG